MIPLGYNVETAVNGLDALEKIKSNNYQLIIVDHLMPLMNGVQLTKNLKYTEQYKNIPILFMTTQGAETVKLMPEYKLFFSVIDKPINKVQLLNLISKLNENIFCNQTAIINS